MDPLTPNPELYNIPFEASTFNGMPYRTLGHSGLRVPNLGLGTWKFGRPETGDRSRVDSQTAMRIFDRAVELGVTFWDTANRYFSSSGNSERVIGQWLAHNPDQRRNIILATKVYGLMDGLTPNHGGSSRISILASVQACLQRLQTDYIDLLYLHRFDSRTPPEESLAAVEDLVRQGLVRYFAVSNFTCDQLSLYRSLEREFSPRVRVLAVQNRFDLLNGEEAQHPGVLAYCAENRISFVAWSPLARGLLTDRYLDLNRVGPGDRLFDEGTLQKDRQGDALVRLQTLAGLAREWELELSQLVLAYTLSLPGMGPLIPAASSEAQIESNAAAGRIILDEQQCQRVRRVLAPAPGSAEDSGGAAR